MCVSQRKNTTKTHILHGLVVVSSDDGFYVGVEHASLCLGHELAGDHAVGDELQLAALDVGDAAVGVERAGVVLGRAYQTGQVDALGHGELVGTLVEVELGGLPDADYARRPFDDVDVDLKQTLLADEVLVFDHPYQQHLLELPGEHFLATEEEVLDQLHGDGAAAATHLAGLDVVDQRLLHRRLAKAVVYKEGPVFGGEDGLL